MIWIVMGITAWVACGIGAWGFTLAYFSRKWPTLWRVYDDERPTFIVASVVAVMGPIGLIAVSIQGGWSYGWALWA